MARVEQGDRDRKARGADEPPAGSTLKTELGWALGLTILTLCVVGIISRYALLCALSDGLTAAVVLLPAVLAVAAFSKEARIVRYGEDDLHGLAIVGHLPVVGFYDT